MVTLSALFPDVELRFVLANGYRVAGSATGPLQGYPNESNVEEISVFYFSFFFFFYFKRNAL